MARLPGRGVGHCPAHGDRRPFGLSPLVCSDQWLGELRGHGGAMAGQRRGVRSGGCGGRRGAHPATPAYLSLGRGVHTGGKSSLDGSNAGNKEAVRNSRRRAE